MVRRLNARHRFPRLQRRRGQPVDVLVDDDNPDVKRRKRPLDVSAAAAAAFALVLDPAPILSRSIKEDVDVNGFAGRDVLDVSAAAAAAFASVLAFRSRRTLISMNAPEEMFWTFPQLQRQPSLLMVLAFAGLNALQIGQGRLGQGQHGPRRHGQR